jgi:hypothetical protein
MLRLRLFARPMPLQNRVTPFGDIVAIPQRGMFMGNRGIIHDPATKTLLRKRWSNKAWIICACSYKNRRRDVMATRSWTELFFLDEAVALAAGHRPCFACRRESADSFRFAWSAAKRTRKSTAASIDDMLHRERLRDGHKRIHPLGMPICNLPDGAVVAIGGNAFTVAHKLAFRWTEDGYAPPQEIEKADGLLTPPSTIQTMIAGYRPALHTNIFNFIAAKTAD